MRNTLLNKKSTKLVNLVILSAFTLTLISQSVSVASHEDIFLHETEDQDVNESGVYQFNEFINWGTASILSEIKIDFLNFVIFSIIKIAPSKTEIDEKKRPHVIVNGKLVKSKQTEHSAQQGIKGKTLEIYYYIVEKNSDVGVREVQKEFSYSSPGLAAYHLNRLLDFNIVEKNEKNRYEIVNPDIKLGLLQDSVKLSHYWIPRNYIIAAFNLMLAMLGLLYFLGNVHEYVWPLTYVPTLLMISYYLIINEKPRKH
ncbi:MAG: hypothetical protein ACXAD7_14620 [Candidatus Kariarchaeaceae archaeon]|jgi:hypothetical protein